MWLTGMRSGEYRWCWGSLRQGEKYCGLAVLLATQGIPVPSVVPVLEAEEWLNRHMSIRLEDLITLLNDQSYTQYAPVIADVEMAMEDYITA